MSVKPDNCHLTGYIPYEQYVGLMRQVDTVIDLTDRDHTLLLGAFEAVSLGTPLIISDWPILREYIRKARCTWQTRRTQSARAFSRRSVNTPRCEKK